MIINKSLFKAPLLHCLSVLFLFSACSGSKKEEEEKRSLVMDSLSRPENISLVSAIAKVEPEDGLIELSADVSGIVTEVYKKEGDSVQKDEALFRLDQQQAVLDSRLARQEMLVQQARLSADLADIRQFEASLKEKDEDLQITRSLAGTGADTRQNVSIKEKEREVILANLQAAKAKANAGSEELRLRKTKVEQATELSDNRLITAPQDGLLVSLNARKGNAITAFSTYGTLAGKGKMIIHGEIDEMFAGRVKIGQQVSVTYVGSSTLLATGKVIYLSAVLDGQSLFYEKTGESTDRRVRKFKAAFSVPTDLLMNARVECKIKIQ